MRFLASSAEHRVVREIFLVSVWTARRTGATLMYLSGMDVYDIIKITGHASPAILKKYIRADELTVLQKITDNYSYFN